VPGRHRQDDPPVPLVLGRHAVLRWGRQQREHSRQPIWRVAVVASSNWSHSFLTAKNHYIYPDLPSDRARFEELRNGQFDRWQALTTAQLEDAGQRELLNWVCLAGAGLDGFGGDIHLRRAKGFRDL
jgi:hypothetical protein